MKFVIMPIHMDLQNQIVELGLEQDLKRFKDDLKSLGTLYDFHIESHLTTDREQYADPVHGKEPIVESAVRILFTDPELVDDPGVEITVRNPSP